MTIRVRMPAHLAYDADVVAEVERAAQEYASEGLGPRDDDEDGEYDGHHADLEASSAHPLDDITGGQ